MERTEFRRLGRATEGGGTTGNKGQDVASLPKGCRLLHSTVRVGQVTCDASGKRDHEWPSNFFGFRIPSQLNQSERTLSMGDIPLAPLESGERGERRDGKTTGNRTEKPDRSGRSPGEGAPLRG